MPAVGTARRAVRYNRPAAAPSPRRSSLPVQREAARQSSSPPLPSPFSRGARAAIRLGTPSSSSALRPAAFLASLISEDQRSLAVSSSLRSSVCISGCTTGHPHRRSTGPWRILPYGRTCLRYPVSPARRPAPQHSDLATPCIANACPSHARDQRAPAPTAPAAISRRTVPSFRPLAETHQCFPILRPPLHLWHGSISRVPRSTSSLCALCVPCG